MINNSADSNHLFKNLVQQFNPQHQTMTENHNLNCQL